MRALALLLLCSCVARHPGRAPRTTGHVSYVVGYKRADAGWAPARDHLTFGLIDLDLRPHDWPLSIAMQVLLGHVDEEPALASGIADNAGTYELNLGLRKLWDRGRLEPYVGGGLSLLGASVSDWVCVHQRCFQDQTDNDATLGTWIGAGVFGGEGRRTWGVHLQRTEGDVRLHGEDIDAGGLALLFSFGTRW